MAEFQRETGHEHAPYAAFHQWSIDQPAQFWQAVWNYTNVIGDPGGTVVEDFHLMPGARFFPDARLNFAENLLRNANSREAIVFQAEDRVTRRLTRVELHTQTARLAAALQAHGVKPGDRIAAWLPNMPETVIAMLAAATIGATFSSCSPDFGVEGVVDRFGQIEPVVLFVADGYFYDGKTFETLDKAAQIAARLPTVKHVVVVPLLNETPNLPNAIIWNDFLQEPAPTFDRFPFNHPLYILYSSGTTGVPKCIVHGAGGTLLQHLKEHQLHGDIRAGDRVFYFTTCGWMMWNWLASALASEAAILLYDGSPFHNGGRTLLDFLDRERATHFGTSAKFLDALAKSGLRPIEHWPLKKIRIIFSTGSPLAPEGFDFVYRNIKRDVCLSSISGGTDIVSCFVLGNPTLPVYRGEIQCKGLGMAVNVFNSEGKPIQNGEAGELVCTRPFPSMPLGFWNDLTQKTYKAAYFERFEKVWHHGDYARITDHDGIVILGRSDATLNPGGVRIGTAEIYRQVERLPEILESIAVGQDFSHDVRVILFVKLRPGINLDEALKARIKQTIRANTTPRHVPAKIIAVPDIPRTKSGKLVELAVREIIHGRIVRNQEALANPEALEHFRNLSFED